MNYPTSNIRIYNSILKGEKWLNKYYGTKPIFTCTLGFTNTGLIEGISAAGATPESRLFTAVADAEFLVNGVTQNPQFPLPPLHVGVSPAIISRAVVEMFDLPVYIFNAGLPCQPSVSAIDVQGKVAKCVTTGNALPLDVVHRLFKQGLFWGNKLAQEASSSYLVLGECVVGGTTTALAVLTALGIEAQGKVNSSHPICNHEQKWQVVQEGLKNAGLSSFSNPLEIVGALGDPMQVFVAGVGLSASRYTGVMLAGGTQMLAVFALMKGLKRDFYPEADLDNVIVGTTRWVVQDDTGDTVNLAQMVGDVPLCVTQLNFSDSIYSSLQSYELGFVKEGVGAGGSAIASHLLQLTPTELMITIENIISRFS